jgi:CheY-like chemotaxis protein
MGPGAREVSRVLLVEDDHATTYILTHQLASRSVCDVTHVATVAEALAKLDPPPDWIILDMDLPDGSGLVILEAIRKADLPTRVIVSSAMPDADLIAAFTAYRPDLIIPKPLDPALLPIAPVGDC